MKDLYFDSKQWTVRYVVIDTRKWLPGKKVLISPIAVNNVDLLNSNIDVLATEEQVSNSPSVEEHQPVSRQLESEINRYYGWFPYWTGTGVWGDGVHPRQMAPTTENLGDENRIEVEDKHNEYLRSMNELKGNLSGYTIQAQDKEVGHVVDFVIDDEAWAIHYLIVDTGNWLPGTKVLLEPDSITEIDWVTKKVYVNLPSDEIERRSAQTVDNNDVRNMEGVSIEDIWKRRIS